MALFFSFSCCQRTSQSVQHVINIDFDNFELCQVGKTNPWHTNVHLWRYHIDHLVCKARSNLLHNDASCRIPKHASAAVGASIFTLGSFCTYQNFEKMQPCLLDKSHESRIDWTYSSRLWKWCENAGCSTGTQAELDLGSFLRSSWKYFRNFLWLFLCTKHTSGPVLRGPTLLS